MNNSKKQQSAVQRALARNLGLMMLLGAGVMTWSCAVMGETVYRTGFEPPAYVEGGLVGQDGWIAPPPFSPNAAVVTRDKPRQGKQTVHVLGEDLDHQDFINAVTGGYYDAIGSYRRPVNYDTGNSQTVRISAHVRVDGPATAGGNNFFSAALSTRAATTLDGVGEIAISSDGHAYVYSGNDSVPSFLASMPVALGEWHCLAVVADFANKQSTFYVDGVLLGTFPFESSEIFTGVLLRGTLLAYAAPDNASAHKANYAAHYDQFSIHVTD